MIQRHVTRIVGQTDWPVIWINLDTDKPVSAWVESDGVHAMYVFTEHFW